MRVLIDDGATPGEINLRAIHSHDANANPVVEGGVAQVLALPLLICCHQLVEQFRVLDPHRPVWATTTSGARTRCITVLDIDIWATRDRSAQQVCGFAICRCEVLVILGAPKLQEFRHIIRTGALCSEAFNLEKLFAVSGDG